MIEWILLGILCICVFTPLDDILVVLGFIVLFAWIKKRCAK